MGFTVLVVLVEDRGWWIWRDRLFLSDVVLVGRRMVRRGRLRIGLSENASLCFCGLGIGLLEGTGVHLIICRLFDWYHVCFVGLEKHFRVLFFGLFTSR